MKKNILNIFCICAFLFSVLGQGQCLYGTNGEYPSTYFTVPTGNGVYHTISSNCQTGQYSVVYVTAGNTYSFSTYANNNPDLYVSICDFDHNTLLTYGPDMVTWVASFTGAVNFYTFYGPSCGEQSTNPVTRAVACTNYTLQNDTCANAIEILPNNPMIQGSTVSATSTAGLTPSCQSNAINDVWYKATVISNNFTIETSAVSGSNFTDSVISVYTGTCGALTEIACNDDISTTNYFSKVVLTNLTPYSVVYIAVRRYGSGGGDGIFKINVYQNAPINDNCSGATLLPQGTVVTDSNYLAATTPGSTLPASCQPYRVKDLWYYAYASPQGNLTVQTSAVNGSPFTDSIVSVYSGTCSALTELGCNEDISGTNYFSSVSLTGLVPNSQVYIGVWNYYDSATFTGEPGFFRIIASHNTLDAASFESDNFKLYPNPASNEINVSNNRNTGISAITIIDVNGRTVKQNTFDNLPNVQMNIADLSKGIYLMKISSEEGIATKKWIKN